ncbi:Txe/YoeB family addiction module toxin [Deltaproteobacteria bacterium TL4]
MNRKILFEQQAFEDFTQWSQEQLQIFQKILRLVREISREPFKGIGKPEPLKNQLQGYWSRRITDEHRLVYKVTEETLIVASCRYHYPKNPP